MTREDKRELKVRRAVALANELVPADKTPADCYYRKWQDVFNAMVAPEPPWASAASVTTETQLDS